MWLLTIPPKAAKATGRQAGSWWGGCFDSSPQLFDAMDEGYFLFGALLGLNQMRGERPADSRAPLVGTAGTEGLP